MSKRDFIKDIDSDELQSVLKKYDFEIVNQVPFSEKELMVFYEKYTDPLLTEARRLTNDNIFVLGNEMRAMLGHLADYRQNLQYRKNLKDAYGHFRRLNVDAFKIICDEADKSLLRYLKKHVHYDFRNVNSSFLFEYSQKYFKAKSLYLKAQVAEKTGSDVAQTELDNERHHDCTHRQIDSSLLCGTTGEFFNARLCRIAARRCDPPPPRRP